MSTLSNPAAVFRQRGFTNRCPHCEITPPCAEQSFGRGDDQQRRCGSCCAQSTAGVGTAAHSAYVCRRSRTLRLHALRRRRHRPSSAGKLTLAACRTTQTINIIDHTAVLTKYCDGLLERITSAKAAVAKLHNTPPAVMAAAKPRPAAAAASHGFAMPTGGVPKAMPIVFPAATAMTTGDESGSSSDSSGGSFDPDGRGYSSVASVGVRRPYQRGISGSARPSGQPASPIATARRDVGSKRPASAPADMEAASTSSSEDDGRHRGRHKQCPTETAAALACTPARKHAGPASILRTAAAATVGATGAAAVGTQPPAAAADAEEATGRTWSARGNKRVSFAGGTKPAAPMPGARVPPMDAPAALAPTTASAARRNTGASSKPGEFHDDMSDIGVGAATMMSRGTNSRPTAGSAGRAVVPSATHSATSPSVRTAGSATTTPALARSKHATSAGVAVALESTFAAADGTVSAASSIGRGSASASSDWNAVLADASPPSGMPADGFWRRQGSGGRAATGGNSAPTAATTTKAGVALNSNARSLIAHGAESGRNATAVTGRDGSGSHSTSAGVHHRAPLVSGHGGGGFVRSIYASSGMAASAVVPPGKAGAQTASARSAVSAHAQVWRRGAAGAPPVSAAPAGAGDSGMALFEDDALPW